MYQLFAGNAFLLSSPEKYICSRAHNGAGYQNRNSKTTPNSRTPAFHYARARERTPGDNTFNQGRKWFRHANFDSYAVSANARASRHCVVWVVLFPEISIKLRVLYSCRQDAPGPPKYHRASWIARIHSMERDSWSAMSQLLSLSLFLSRSLLKPAFHKEC